MDKAIQNLKSQKDTGTAFQNESNRVMQTEKYQEKQSLLELEEGQRAKIVCSPDHCLLAPLGFRPGKVVEIKSRQPFQGPIVAEIEGRQIAVDRSLADRIILELEVAVHAAG